MLKLKINKSIFNPIYVPYLESTTPTQLFFGGSSSGKSYFLAQRCIVDMAKGGRNYLVLRKVARDTKKTVWNEVIKALKRFKLYDHCTINKSDLTITFPNGYQMLFGGLDDRERIKGITPQKGVITDIWLEEATEFDEDDLKQLEKRLRGKSKVSKRVLLSFNPIIKTHWIYTRFFNNWDESKNIYQSDDLLILKTTYLDNIFLTADDIKRIKSETDEYYIDVYLKGNWGIMGDIIFRNWRVEDIDELLNTVDRSCHGLDFGFASDPAAFVKQYYDSSKKTLYVFDEGGGTGLTDPQLATAVKQLIGNDEIICDSAEPKSITHLQNAGIRARGVKKGPGSIETSYKWLLSIQIVIHPRCVNLKRELQTHQWQADKHGNTLPKPEDRNNHWIDALRYGLSDYWNGMGGFEVW